MHGRCSAGRTVPASRLDDGIILFPHESLLARDELDIVDQPRLAEA
jgi:hypothetical protein